MMTNLISYVAALVVFVAVDMVWLGTMSGRFYKPMLGDILAPQFNMAAAAAFYLLYPVGLVIFAITPALKAGGISTALLFGALFGFITYATYDLTNQVTLRNWSSLLTVVDMAWGSFLGAVTAASACWIVSRLAA